MQDEGVAFLARFVRERDAESFRVLRVDLVRREGRGLVVRVDEIPFILHDEVEELVGPHLDEDRLAPSLRVGGDEILVRIPERLRHAHPDLEIVRHRKAAVLEEIPCDLEADHEFLLRHLDIRHEGVAVRHRERPQPTKAGDLAALFRAERIPR